MADQDGTRVGEGGDAPAGRTLLERAAEALPDALAIHDAEGLLLLCNARYRELHPEAEPGRTRDFCLPLPDDGQACCSERLHRDGNWYRVVRRPMAEGGTVCMWIDITPLKQAEQRLSQIIEGAEAGTWEWVVASGENVINGRWAEMLGYRAAELAPVTIDVWRGLVHPDDLARVDMLLARVFARETDQFEYELRMRHRDGHWATILSRGRVVRWSPDGMPEVMSGVHLDLTARRRAEQHLEEIIDAAEAGTWEFDYVRGQSNINDRWAEMLGYSRAELARLPGFGFRELIHPDDLASLDRVRDDTLTRGVSVFAHELRMRHREGHWVWVLSRGRVVERNALGQAIKSAGIHLDITDRKQLEAALVDERDYLARLMETSESCITALDAEGRIVFASRAAETVLGLSAPAVEGRRHDDPVWRITATDGGPFEAADLPFARVLREGQPVRGIRHAITGPDGRRRILSVNATPVRAEALPVRVVCAINDITDQVAAEEAMRAAADRAEAASRAKSAFLANMSHEIRTPLNGVLGMAELLADTPLTPLQQEILGTIRDSGDALLTIINDILDLARIESGKVALDPVPFVPAELARRIEALHGVTARAKGLALRVDLARGATTSRLGDPTRIGQILHNLLGNAVKFTETGAVTLRLAGHGDRLAITVEDSGIGMTREQLARVFEEFEQGDNSVTRRFGGSGLGLAIVRKLVEMIGGEIRMESEPGRGTRIEVLLEAPAAAPTAPAEVPPPGPVPCFAGLRVLVAEDNRTNRKIIEIMLERLGITATFVGDGQQACDLWRPGAFDLLLLDVSMPRKDGVETLAEIEARARVAGAPRPRAIAATANVMADQIDGYRARGFAAVLGKPFRQQDLVEALRRALTPA